MRARGGYSRRMVKRRLGKTRVDLLVGIVKVIPLNCSIIDLGAGTGRYVKALRELGYLIDGVDGGVDVERISGGLVFFGDLTDKSLHNRRENSYDWGLFLDVGEHIPGEYESVLIDGICRMCRNGLIVSWGLPGQRGCGHVNCRTSEYVASEFAVRGFCVDDDLTRDVRLLGGKSFRNRVMVLTWRES